MERLMLAWAVVLVCGSAVGQETYKCQDDGGAYESYVPCPEGNELTDGKRREAAPKSCLSDWQCWLERHRFDARIACSLAVERQARYDFDWTDGLFGAKFPAISRGSEAHELRLRGDAIRLMTGLGTWVPHSYSCDFDPLSSRVTDIRVEPGRR